MEEEKVKKEEQEKKIVINLEDCNDEGEKGDQIIYEELSIKNEEVKEIYSVSSISV